MVKKKGIDEVIADFLNAVSLERHERWILDPKNKDFVDELRADLRENAHIKMDLDEPEDDE
jgi:hypothetical protein